MNRTLKSDIENLFDEIEDSPEKIIFKINDINIRFFYTNLKIITRNSNIDNLLQSYQVNFSKKVNGRTYQIEEEGFTIDDIKIFLENISQIPISTVLATTNTTLIMNCFTLLVDLNALNFIDEFINSDCNILINAKEMFNKFILKIAPIIDSLLKLYSDKEINENSKSLDKSISNRIIEIYLKPILNKKDISDEEVSNFIFQKEIEIIHNNFLNSTKIEYVEDMKKLLSGIHLKILDEIITIFNDKNHLLNFKSNYNLCKLMIQYSTWLNEKEICLNIIDAILDNDKSSVCIESQINSNFISNSVLIDNNNDLSKHESLLTSKIENLVTEISNKEKNFSNFINQKINEISNSLTEENMCLKSKIEELEKKIMENSHINSHTQNEVIDEFMKSQAIESIKLNSTIEELISKNISLEVKNQELENKTKIFEEKLLSMSEMLNKKIIEKEKNNGNSCKVCKNALKWCRQGNAASKVSNDCSTNKQVNHNNYYRYYCTTCDYALCTQCCWPKGDICGCGRKLDSIIKSNHMCDICRKFLDPNIAFFRCDLCDYDACKTCLMKSLIN